MDILLLITYVSIFSVIVPLSLAILHWNRISPDISALRWLLVASLIFDVVMFILAIVFSLTNLVVGGVYMFIQFTVLLYIFSLQFQRKNIFIVAYVSMALFYLSGLFFFEGSIASLVGSNAVDGLILMIISIMFFYKLLNELKVVEIHRLPMLWIAFGTLLYYSANLFVFLASHYLEKDIETYRWFWAQHAIFNISKNILFAVGLWQSYRTMKSSA
jgi:hypothetical protein